MKLRDKYSISIIEEAYCTFLRFIRGTNKCPKSILKRSRKKYGRRDNLGRYYYERFCGVTVGKFTYGYEFFDSQQVVSIGKFCSIGPYQTVVPNDHNLNWVTTSPITKLKEFSFTNEDYVCDRSMVVNRNITIGNDVWIGANCIIFEGVHISDGAVIAAASIIRRDVPPYAVVGGVDRIIKYRFSKDIVSRLLDIKWWDWDEKKIRENITVMQNVERFIDLHGRG